MKLKALSRSALFLTFIGLDFAMAAAVCEVWIRCFIPVKNICYLTDPKLGVTFCPNQSTYGYVEPGYSNLLITNSAGFHDVERLKPKAPGTYRIEIFGDSMIQGFIVPTDATLTSSLERHLNSRGLPAKIEVVNMASGDDGTTSQIATFQEIGRRYNPDLVLCYFMDDFGDNLLEIHRREWSPYYILGNDNQLELVSAAPKDSTNPWERFKKESRLYRLLANKLLESKFYADFERFLHEADKKIRIRDANTEKSYAQIQQEICIRKGWPLTLRLFKKFDEVVTAQGSDFIVVDGRTFSPEGLGTVYSNKDVESYCKLTGIRYIPNYLPHERLMNSKDKSKYLFLDNHPKASGYELLSRNLADNLSGFIRADLDGIARNGIRPE